jgi:glycosyltransferase involved in cell wall biosynthesis
MLLYVASDIGGVNGAPQAARDILISLLLSGYPVTVISQSQCQLPEEIDGIKLPLPKWVIPVKKIYFPSKRHRNLANLIKWLGANFQRVIQQQSLQKLNPKLIFVNGLNSDKLWKTFNLEFCDRTAIIIHMSPRHCQYNAKLDLNQVLTVIKEYSHFFFVSATCQKEWLSLEKLPAQHSYYVPNCCKEDIVNTLIRQDKQQIRQNLGMPIDKFIVVCVASLQPRKGQDLLIEKFSELLKIVPELRLYLVGPIADTQWTKALFEKIDSNNFRDRIEYVGAKDNAMDFIYAADLFVLPSHAEAMPLSILEAMALKTPVLASNVDGVPELIDHEIDGLLFSHEQPQSFVDAFAKIANNSNLRQTFAECAHQKYWSNFSRNCQFSRYKKAIEEAIFSLKG